MGPPRGSRADPPGTPSPGSGCAGSDIDAGPLDVLVLVLLVATWTPAAIEAAGQLCPVC
jgi:hypothetical protein